jgi:nickel transport protein
MNIRVKHHTVRVGTAALALAAIPALAHDLWVETEGTTHTLRYGHERSRHAGERTLVYPSDFVKAARCFGADGREAPAKLEAAHPARLVGRCAATLFIAGSGYWTKTPYGTENRPKTEAGPAIDSWESFDAVKTIVAWSPAFARPLDEGLELVPAANPLALKAGDKLTVGVYWQGRPRAGVAVAYHGNARGVSDTDGRINIRLREAGFQLLQASVDEPPRDPAKADRAVFAANLGFTLP